MAENSSDHKKIGADLDLFFTHEIAPGAVFWLPKGMIIFKELEKYIRELTEKMGYLETSTPIMVKNDLFKQSGHWTKFGEHNMYNLQLREPEEVREMLEDPLRAEAEEKIKRVGNEYIITPDYSLKPMNCPESTILYSFRSRSYRELPLRFSEIGRLHRREKSGEVNGLLRVRQITMDDAHIYAREDQIHDEISKIVETMTEFYESFGFEYDFRLATRPEQFAGTTEGWEKAEQMLTEILKSKKIKYTIKDKDGAFYGPKIDLHIKDSQSRDWQLATVQLDFHQPRAFDLFYIDEKGEKRTPAMIHRAVFGSFERFIGIFTEHFAGAFPVWLSPVQVKIIPISDKVLDYARTITDGIKESGLRTELDDRNETLPAKIRDSQNQKIPFMIILGEKERQTALNQVKLGHGVVSLRLRDGRNIGQLQIDEFINHAKNIALTRSLNLW